MAEPELTLTMVADRAARKCRKAARITRNGPVRLTAKVRFQSSSVVSSSLATRKTPAALTIPSSPPSAVAAASTATRTEFSSETSAPRREGGGARVAAAEYLLTGAGLVLFFVLLLAFSEVIGFTAAYLVASAAVIGLLSAYSAAVLRSWKRGRFIGALLVGLYALLFVLLNLEAWSLLIGSVLLFVALAGVMFATRKVDWGSVGRREVVPG